MDVGIVMRVMGDVGPRCDTLAFMIIVAQRDYIPAV